MKLNYKTAATAIALTLGATVALTSTTAMAFGGKGGDRMGNRGGFMTAEFADVDLNGDGQITVEDLQAAAAARFAEVDTDGNGEVTSDELKAQMETRMAERGDAQGRDGKGDRQGKGSMMEKRMGWKLEDMIEKRDTDKNGTLSAEEMAPEAERLERLIDRFDTDDDNAISEAEFDAAQKEMFSRKGRDGKGHGGKDRDGKGRK